MEMIFVKEEEKGITIWFSIGRLVGRTLIPTKYQPNIMYSSPIYKGFIT